MLVSEFVGFLKKLKKQKNGEYICLYLKIVGNYCSLFIFGVKSNQIIDQFSESAASSSIRKGSASVKSVISCNFYLRCEFFFQSDLINTIVLVTLCCIIYDFSFVEFSIRKRGSLKMNETDYFIHVAIFIRLMPFQKKKKKKL